MKIKKIIWSIRQKYTNVGSAKTSDFQGFIKKHVPSGRKTILDVGCGQLYGNSKNEDITLSLFKNHDITGIDGFAPNIEWRKQNQKGKFYVMDVRKAKELGKFDVLICNHVIEHLEKNESIKLLNDFESIAKTIIIGTPVGYVDTEYNVKLHNNELERHLCGFTPKEFEERGYVVKIIKNSFMAIKNS